MPAVTWMLKKTEDPVNSQDSQTRMLVEQETRAVLRRYQAGDIDEDVATLQILELISRSDMPNPEPFAGLRGLD